MRNFMCQLDWATGCPDIWSDFILWVSVNVFQGKINFWIAHLNKAGYLLFYRWALYSQVKFWTEQKGWKLSCLSWDTFLSLNLNWNMSSWISNLPVFSLKLTLLALLLLFGLYTGTIPLTFLDLQLDDCKPWDLSASTIT